MTAMDNALVTMIGTTLNLIGLNSVEVATKPKFELMVDELKDYFDLIEALAIIEGRDDRGISIEKADSRFLLETKGHRIGRALYSWAMSEGNDLIAKPVDDSLSSLKLLDDSKLTYEMLRYLKYAQDNAADLLDWDILAADITDFEASITTFKEWKFDPRTATAQRKNAGYELRRTIRKAVDFLSKRMDPAMYLFQDSGTSFYGDYFNARIIVDPAGPDSETQTGINPIETDTIINLPFTNLGANKDVLIKCLTPGTNFEIYCSNAPSVPPAGTPLSINDVISPIYTTTDELGWLPDSPYINIHFPPLPVEIEWEVRVG